MAALSEKLDRALQLHQAGNLAEAEGLYLEIIEADPRQAHAWHLSGLIAHSRGEHPRALERIERALALDPTDASFHNHMGEVYRSLSRLAEAETCCRRAVELRPSWATAHNTLGVVLSQQGRTEHSLASYRQAVALDPNFAQAHLNLGNTWQALGQLDAAIASYQSAIAAKTDYLLAYDALATALRAADRIADEVKLRRDLVALHPQNGLILYNLAQALQRSHELVEAEVEYRRAIELTPDLAVAHHNLGTLLQLVGRLAEARACYDAAIELQPDFADAHGSRAMLRLLLGEDQAGFQEYEWRFQVPAFPQTRFREPRWQGEPLAGRTILLWAEQGYGDLLQCVRFAQLVKQRGARVVVECLPRLHPLLATAPGVDRLIAHEAEREPFAFQCPMMSLPAVLQSTVATIPPAPYLFAQPERVARWKQHWAGDRALRVGIAWQGNPRFVDDFYRSIPLAAFAPLAACSGVQLYCLQKNHGREQLASWREAVPIVDLWNVLDEGDRDFVEVAAVMKNLDLVITSDSALAHLAGALGVPVWVALQQTPNWCWLLDRRDSPWYGSARLFRQSRLGDWSDVFASMAVELRSLSPKPRLS